jgi:hypothetical protein
LCGLTGPVRVRDGERGERERERGERERESEWGREGERERKAVDARGEAALEEMGEYWGARREMALVQWAFAHGGPCHILSGSFLGRGCHQIPPHCLIAPSACVSLPSALGCSSRGAAAGGSAAPKSSWPKRSCSFHAVTASFSMAKMARLCTSSARGVDRVEEEEIMLPFLAVDAALSNDDELPPMRGEAVLVGLVARAERAPM